MLSNRLAVGWCCDGGEVAEGRRKFARVEELRVVGCCDQVSVRFKFLTPKYFVQFQRFEACPILTRSRCICRLDRRKIGGVGVEFGEELWRKGHRGGLEEFVFGDGGWGGHGRARWGGGCHNRCRTWARLRR